MKTGVTSQPAFPGTCLAGWQTLTPEPAALPSQIPASPTALTLATATASLDSVLIKLQDILHNIASAIALLSDPQRPEGGTLKPDPQPPKGGTPMSKQQLPEGRTY